MKKSIILTTALITLLCLAAAALCDEPVVKVHRKTTEPRTVAVIKQKGPYTGIPDTMNKLMGAVEKGGHMVCGPLMAVYYNDPSSTPPADLMWDVRVPVTNPGSMREVEHGELGFGYMDPAYVAYTYHIGSYDTAYESYNLLFDWARTNKYDVTGYITEIYWSEPSAKKAVTEIWLPVKEKTPAERAIR